MSDRLYVRAPDATERIKAHALLTWTRVPRNARTVCNRNVPDAEAADRLRPDWRLCGTCARSVFASTDIEESTDMGDFGNAVAPI